LNINLLNVVACAINYALLLIYNARENAINTENQISNEHITNNKAVRQTLVSRGIVPENVTPNEDVKKIERKLNSESKKALKTKDKLQGDIK
jgi:DNA-damage-inducible protein D